MKRIAVSLVGVYIEATNDPPADRHVREKKISPWDFSGLRRAAMDHALRPPVTQEDVALVMGCGGAYPDSIKVGASCTSAGGVQVEVEAGMGNDAAGVCWSFGQALDIYRATYEERWGPVDLAGWTLRVRSTTLVDGAAGATWWDERLIEVEPHMLDALPHELRHVQLGSSSAGHAGWCGDYWPRERATLGLDEGTYLGCGQ